MPHLAATGGGAVGGHVGVCSAGGMMTWRTSPSDRDVQGLRRKAHPPHEISEARIGPDGIKSRVDGKDH
jgi:hypothetical protein